MVGARCPSWFERNVPVDAGFNGQEDILASESSTANKLREACLSIRQKRTEEDIMDVGGPLWWTSSSVQLQLRLNVDQSAPASSALMFQPSSRSCLHYCGSGALWWSPPVLQDSRQ